jgi:hypothetical protein
VQQVETRNINLRFVRLARAHLCHQPVKVRGTPGIDQGELAIENGRFCGQLGEGFTHARQFVCVLGAVPPLPIICLLVIINLFRASSRKRWTNPDLGEGTSRERMLDQNYEQNYLI